MWYRRLVAPDLPDHLDEGVRDFCERENRAFFDGILSALPVERWLSPPDAIARAEKKPYQLKIANQLGFTIPKTSITNDPQSVLALAHSHQLIAKAVSSGYVRADDGYSAIFTSEVRETDLDDLGTLSLAPVTFQERIEKSVDIRVTVVDKHVFSAEILSQEGESSRVDWRATDNPDLIHRPHELPSEIERRCRELIRQMGLFFGAIDLALTPRGEYVFFEVNPNGEWVWIEEQLHLPIAKAIADWLS